MKNAIRFIIGAVALEFSLVGACYLDSDGVVGGMAAVRFAIGAVIAAAMYFWSELDRKRAELDKRIKERRRKRENFQDILDLEIKKLEPSEPTKAE